jgi:hypothetical protein
VAALEIVVPLGQRRRDQNDGLGSGTICCSGNGRMATDPAQSAERDIAVCINPGRNAIPFYLARATVSQILKQAGIRIEWHGDARACAASGVSIAIYEQTPADTAAGELARAQPFDGGHVALFYDRVVNSAGPAGVSRLLGHVLAHEIVHMLQDVATHSARGLMKQKWDSRDYVEMRHKPLRLTDEDILRIHAGLEKRAAARNSLPLCIQ